MEEAAASAKEMKEMSVVKEAFVEEVGLKTWDEALATVPEYTAQLRTFKGSKGKGAQFKVLNTSHSCTLCPHQTIALCLRLHRHSDYFGLVHRTFPLPS